MKSKSRAKNNQQMASRNTRVTTHRKARAVKHKPNLYSCPSCGGIGFVGRCSCCGGILRYDRSIR